MWVASRDAIITDLDQDGRIISLDVALTPGRPGDRIYLSENTGCPRSGAPVCRYDCLFRNVFYRLAFDNTSH